MKLLVKETFKSTEVICLYLEILCFLSYFGAMLDALVLFLLNQIANYFALEMLSSVGCST